MDLSIRGGSRLVLWHNHMCCTCTCNVPTYLYMMNDHVLQVLPWSPQYMERPTRELDGDD